MNYAEKIGNTLSALRTFKAEIEHATLIHIPHASTHIPTYEHMNRALAVEEIQLLTDWATEEIFNLPNCSQIGVSFSRVFCDVERLPDAQESMFSKGRGFYYTHCDNGEQLREDIPELKQMIYENYYQTHHKRLLDACQEKIDQHGFCFLIDGHSFSEKPLQTEENQALDRPDICLGTDEFHTPKSWLNSLKAHFEKNGLSVAVNHPYSGTIVPLPMYKKEKRLYSIMIEVNKRCYMENGEVIPEKVKFLNDIMKTMND